MKEETNDDDEDTDNELNDYDMLRGSDKLNKNCYLYKGIRKLRTYMFLEDDDSAIIGAAQSPEIMPSTTEDIVSDLPAPGQQYELLQLEDIIDSSSLDVVNTQLQELRVGNILFSAKHALSLFLITYLRIIF